MLSKSVDDAASGGNPTRSGVGVLDKSVAVLSFLSAEGASSLSGVVEGTGIPRPTAHRLLSALETHHLVARREGRYVLGARLLGWASRVESGAGLVEAARPALEWLVGETGESAQLYVREGENRVCVASRERASGLRDTVPVGAVMPLSVGSAAKVLLAWSPEPAERVGFETERGRGWAESVAERERGVASVSAPVVSGGTLAAVSVSGPVSRLGEKPGERLSELVLRAAREIEGGIAEV
ncbi:IclR family transcriptional regulator [Rubrobacter aplysinae]|uniref:IclR family transcriptional regulator n=1 Tax=Rubrobacter aplysinae TaxID=909625 RepID=UPI00064BF4BF|nr:IclR family transcriptional regulator [Rubrobacter aplysinae]